MEASTVDDHLEEFGVDGFVGEIDILKLINNTFCEIKKQPTAATP